MLLINRFKYITNKYHLKNGMHVDMNLINKIVIIEKIDIEDLQVLLQINNTIMKKLKTGKQRYTKLNFNHYKGIKAKKFVNKGNITYEEFVTLKILLDVKDYTLIKMLGISVYSYKKMKFEGRIVKVKDIRIKHIVDLIKVDLKYQFEKYCTIEEVKEICQNRKITIDDFAKYYSDNPKHYKFNSILINNSEKGFWIGSDTKIPRDFTDANQLELNSGLKKVANKVSSMIGSQSFKEDLVNDTYCELVEKCGVIVRNFSFNSKILFNILMAKAKYMMINIYRKKYKQHDISYDSFEDINLDCLDFLKDERYNPQLLFL